MRRCWLVVVVLGLVATGCGGPSQEQIFRQAGVDSATKGTVLFGSDCDAAARAEVGSKARGHPGWTATQRKTYEAAFVDGCLSALKPVQGVAQ
jgi:hypothetical protein